MFCLYFVDYFYRSFFICIINPSFTALALSCKSIWMKDLALPNLKTNVTATNLDEAVYVIDGFTFDGKITDIVEMYNSPDNT